jgi:hypothetical protein
MANRHRIPTIFTLSMVDVLCCALGCVILLWLLNLHEAKQKAVAAGQTAKVLTLTQSRLAATRASLTATEELARDTAQRLATATDERERVASSLRAAQARADELDKSLANAQSQYAETADRLAKKTRQEKDRASELLAAQQKLQALDLLIREKDAMARTANQAATELAEHLRDADTRLKQVRLQADQLPVLQEDLRSAREKLAATDVKVQGLESELAGSRQTLAIANQEKRTLADQVVRARAAADNRFAGISLTGRRVVFLVDMSGSMEMVDENTEAPQKWTEVRQTLARIMRSLPDLEKFQVILFSNKVVYLLGNDQRWLDFDPVTSTSRVAEALAAIKPRGNTDMHSAFEAAFRFRQQGLDTIYVFSDGLPNIGAGLSMQEAQALKETERSEILSKYIRQVLKSSWNRRVDNQSLVRINTVGFFYESPDVGAFLWALARENDGSFVGMSKP